MGMMTRPRRRRVRKYTSRTNKRRSGPPTLMGAPEMRAIDAPTISDSLLVGTIHLFVQLLQQLGPLFRGQLSLQFFKRQGHDVIVMRAREFRVGGNIEPQLVHEFDVLRAHARRVWAEGVFADGAVGGAHFQRQTRTR